MKRCPKCEITKPLAEFNTFKGGSAYWACRPCLSADRKEKRYARKHHLKTKYGLTLDEFDALAELQAGRCAICDVVADLLVDHDHTTGVNRGLLCHSCNVAIGHLRDDANLLRRAADYLELPSLFETAA